MSWLGKWAGRRHVGFLTIVVGLALAASAPLRDCLAYTAAGDRIFPALGILPPIAPGDGIYVWGWTVPLAGGGVGAPDEATNAGAVFDKTITDRLGVLVNEEWMSIDRVHTKSLNGFDNLETEIKYEVIDDQPHEAILTLGVNREWGGSGAAQIGSSQLGATEPRVYFGKGMGDLNIGYLRPFAVEGFVGYQVADGSPRPDLWDTGIVLEYSVPYLQSKVQSFDLPDWVRHLTPITEALFKVPAGRSFGARTTVLLAPGVSYAGEGWEFLIEALVPETNATAAGTGVRAQFHISLDYLATETIGRPLLSSAP
jgi:hypothetical protein